MTTEKLMITVLNHLKDEAGKLITLIESGQMKEEELDSHFLSIWLSFNRFKNQKKRWNNEQRENNTT